MGAWDSSSFGNDDALDWIDELQESRDLRLLRGTLTALLQEEEYVQAPDCACAVAAAEVVAALQGRPAPDLPDEAVAWVAARRALPLGDLAAVAVEALDVILAESELRELWAEQGQLAAWEQQVLELRGRLRG